MKKLQVEISEEDLKEIEKIYGRSDEKTVDIVVSDILNRYLNVEYFDLELEIND